MYTKEQQALLDHVAHKVETLFSDYQVPAHGIDHISRVVYWAQKLIAGEQPQHPLLCELAAWTHDIGRTREHVHSDDRGHHELSYEMLREWFRDDRAFDILSDEEKKEVLYAVRYHWNDVADTYDTAWILRDADKLDAFGEIGAKRLKEFLGGSEKTYNQGLRNMYQIAWKIRTKTARTLFETEHMIDPIDEAYRSFLEGQIEDVVL